MPEGMIDYKQIENLKINNTRSIFYQYQSFIFVSFTSFLIYSSTLATVQLEYKVQDAYTGLCEREKKPFGIILLPGASNHPLLTMYILLPASCYMISKYIHHIKYHGHQCSLVLKCPQEKCKM